MQLLQAYFETVATQAVLFATQEVHRDTETSGLVELTVSLTEGDKEDASTVSLMEVDKEDASIMKVEGVVKRH